MSSTIYTGGMTKYLTLTDEEASALEILISTHAGDEDNKTNPQGVLCWRVYDRLGEL